MSHSSFRPNPFLRRPRDSMRETPMVTVLTEPRPPSEPAEAAPALHMRNTNRNVSSMSHTLTRLRPRPHRREPPPTERSAPRRVSLQRWILVYIPLLVLIIIVLYITAELLMKQLAVRSLKHTLMALPERPTVGSQSARTDRPPSPALPPAPPTANRYDDLTDLVLQHPESLKSFL